MEVNQENGAMKIGEMMAELMRPASSPDHEILTVVAKYSLQLSPDQQRILNRLQMVALDTRVPVIQRQMLDTFVSEYQVLKRYHDTMRYIDRTVEAMALRRFWSQNSMHGQVIKQQ